MNSLWYVFTMFIGGVGLCFYVTESVNKITMHATKIPLDEASRGQKVWNCSSS